MVIFRAADASDAPRLSEIQRPYVEAHGETLFHEPVEAEQFVRLIGGLCRVYPFLVAEVDGTVAGYAYAAQLRPQAAYQWDVETQVYMDQPYQGAGLGTALMSRLIRVLTVQGFLHGYAAVALPNDQTLALYEKLGFARLGVFPGAGFAQGEWRDVAWLSLDLGQLPPLPTPPTPFRLFAPDELAALIL